MKSIPLPPSVSAFLFSLILVFSCALETTARPLFTVAPEPVWTLKQGKIELGTPAGDLPSTVILDDDEVRLTDRDVERFHHRIERVDTTAGLERVSQLRFYFEPSYQKLAIHFIRIIRGDQTINALKPSEIKVIQTEEELDDQIYNGTLVAVTFLNDIRVGDVIDFAYTVTGDNPVFGRRFVDSFSLAARDPIQISRVRLIAPSDRVLYIRNHGAELEPKVRSLGSEKEYLWETSDVPGLEFEDSTPGWFEQVPFFTVSEFPDWRSVVEWALHLYRRDEALPPKLKAKVDAWVSQFSQPEQRLVAALRFVQQEVRYQGIELGPYSHQPNPAARTLERRFGDCKDKSTLLLTILRHLGFDSAIALVNTVTKHSLDDWQASPIAFDHVIVQTKIGGKTYWLDPTMESQRGAFDNYYDPPYERALVLREDSNSLESIAPPKSESPTTIIRERYTVRSGGGPVSFVVTSTYLGPDADDQRAELSEHSPGDLAKRYLNYYARTNPSIRAAGAPIIEDDQNSNKIIITEKYVVDSFWNDQYHYFRADQVDFQLSKPDISKRAYPLAISHPTYMTQDIEINLPEPANLEPKSEVIAGDSFRFEYTHKANGGTINLSYSLKTLRDNVPADRVLDHLALVDRIQKSTGFQLRASSAAIVRSNPESSKLGIAEFLGVVTLPVAVLITVLVVVKIRRRRAAAAHAFISKPVRGAAPETAMRCRDEAEIEGFARSYKCACGTHPFKPEVLARQEFLRYDGERLSTVKLKCESCGRPNDLYFVRPDNEALEGSVVRL